ncbi:phenazine biosynthesis protein PhzF family [Belliella baltica DSM 15883]|uniref:Phenazine biosynthesis protein PhzF family n=1 Tax=Belliella baltica (strain DSM 15883 / CIP 108006 / LMG 21964 / BA134) TaxID=866536 RepID=I3Z7N8_BELBD|nr:PhzF family phenazine biosynthesis protein [Belliella baltica]AFL85256.1 phenazine biosynthesis protein PhzF family [Belliella baltica DSM 15883]
MYLNIYQIDAFAEKAFEGNPAAVIPLNSWLPDELMQQIAEENNLSETAFYIPDGEGFQIRWFTPGVEVDLCGHATLATAHVIFQHQGFSGKLIKFLSPRSGVLEVELEADGQMTLNFPTDKIQQIDIQEEVIAGFSEHPRELWRGLSDFILIYDNQSQVQNMKVDLSELAKVETRGFIITAPGDQVDFVSRWFGPRVGVNEDPVTGSAHTSLTPLWAEKLSKNDLTAVQLSKRTGKLSCKMLGERVKISGKAVTYMLGKVEI